jgi:hypothetical protein
MGSHRGPRPGGLRVVTRESERETYVEDVVGCTWYFGHGARRRGEGGGAAAC